MNAEAVAITTYSSLFNTNSFFDEPNLIILDDAHSAENYVSSFWSLLIDRSQHAAAFAALAGVITPFCPHLTVPAWRRVQTRQTSSGWKNCQRLFSKASCLKLLLFSTSTPRAISFAIRGANCATLCTHAISTSPTARSSFVRSSRLRAHYPLRVRHAASLYVGDPWGGGDLERVTGRQPIHKIPVPAGWDKQGVGRRFFLFQSGRSMISRPNNLLSNQSSLVGGPSILCQMIAQRRRSGRQSALPWVMPFLTHPRSKNQKHPSFRAMEP